MAPSLPTTDAPAVTEDGAGADQARRVTLTGEPASYRAALETRARYLAADKMGLINDPDGDGLTDDLWRQCLPQARADLPMSPHYEAEDVVNDARALQVYTACEWDELGEDGRIWMTKIIQIAQERALARPAGGDVADKDAPLTADFIACFPDGTRDASSYDDVETALDLAEAESCAPSGRWLKLPERIADLHATIARQAAEIDRLRALAEAGAEETARLRKALERIERWHGEFPPTGQFWNHDSRKEPMSYTAAYGSNGARDFMRGVARDALAAAPSSDDRGGA